MRTWLLLIVAWPLAGMAEVRLVVDTRQAVLQVLDGDTELARYEDISIGRYGKTSFRLRGDNTTPLGQFRIGWIAEDTQYHRFFGITYPDMETASKGYYDGVISKQDWLAIRRAHRAGQTPPQDTALGGQLGIHGIGEGDIEVHRNFNWTNGCVAITNEQIDELENWITIGTPVEIR